jgi:hypothetical protein
MSLKQPSADHYVVFPAFFITSKQITAELRSLEGMMHRNETSISKQALVTQHR